MSKLKWECQFKQPLFSLLVTSEQTPTISKLKVVLINTVNHFALITSKHFLQNLAEV